MSWIEIQSPGFFTTVQDLGRPGYGAIGVSSGSAADPTALRVANRLLGNPPNAAGLEMTLQGGRFLFPEGALIAMGGSDFGVPAWMTLKVPPGEVLSVGHTRSGARCYLCVRGGIRVPLILGSASTDVTSGMGGYCGRSLRRGDRLEIGPEPEAPALSKLAPGLLDAVCRRSVFRVTDGPQVEWFTREAVAAFYNSPYTVSSEVNRMGIRLAGARLQTVDTRELITEGVSLGCIQAPAGGQPMILFVEQQTTGGYPKIANVVAADLPALGQLKPNDEIRFERVDLREARELLYIQERWIRSRDSYL